MFENINIQEDRIFIDITESGCGNGCSYCYIPFPLARQKILSEEQLIDSIAYLTRHPNFKPGEKGTITSICPNSEPFKTEESSYLISLLLKRLLPFGNPIQIASKERIPKDIIEIVKTKSCFRGQVVFFISCSTITRANTIEPYALAPSERFLNFDLCQDYQIRSCLYIKPFLPVTITEVDLFAKVLQDYKPDCACVGIYYKKVRQTRADRSPYEHPVHHHLRSSGLDKKIVDFTNSIQAIFHGPVFHSALCVSAYFRKRYPIPHIWRDFPELCINCRDCESEYNSSPA